MIGVAGVGSRLGSNFELDAERALRFEVVFGRALVSRGALWSDQRDFTVLSVSGGSGVAATAVAGTAGRRPGGGMVRERKRKGKALLTNEFFGYAKTEMVWSRDVRVN